MAVKKHAELLTRVRDAKVKADHRQRGYTAAIEADKVHLRHLPRASLPRTIILHAIEQATIERDRASEGATALAKATALLQDFCSRPHSAENGAP